MVAGLDPSREKLSEERRGKWLANISLADIAILFMIHLYSKFSVPVIEFCCFTPKYDKKIHYAKWVDLPYVLYQSMHALASGRVTCAVSVPAALHNSVSFGDTVSHS